ncbi:sialate O-acetylesterase [Limibacter armeniacum]|uniref:sialate O-acetylesterase n=1 Tax=Limibacter armeniacum TaxID=466084 RepID=UPI002FE63241
MKRMKIWGLSLFACLIGWQAAAQDLKLSSYYTDHLVLQRGEANDISGKAKPNAKVTVLLDGKKFTAKSNDGGTWTVTLPAQHAGIGHTLQVLSSDEKLVINDLAFGDVWICAGQSNMEYPVGYFPYADEEAKNAQNAAISYFNVKDEMDGMPRTEVPGTGWSPATGELVKQLTAVGYFFGRNLADSLQVPIGLVSSNWSGSAIEPWMSEEAISAFPEFERVVNENPHKSFAQINQELSAYRKTWDKEHYLVGQGMEEKWYSPITDFSDWENIQLPNYWENAGLKDFDGAVWFKTTFDKPANAQGDSLVLDLNLIDDYDIAWVNGVKVGETFGNQNWRHYKVAFSDLKEKGNILVLRVFDIGGNGGLNFHPLWATDILKGEWVCKAGQSINADTFPKPAIVNASPFSYPTVLYNAMIAPLKGLKVKGAIWYQGESNAMRAADYDKLLSAMIKDWRKTFGKAEMPFYIVQLANFNWEDNAPKASDWAELREAQQRVADEMESVELISTIEIGEMFDIHPKNKQEVGRRLAIRALDKTYKHSMAVTEGPRFESMKIEGNKIIITFKESGSPIKTTDKYGYVKGFTMAAADEQFHWAKAQIISDYQIEVTCDAVAAPVSVRYAWANNPGELNLYNQENLPAHPFRSDDWKRSTEGIHFSLEFLGL